FEQLEVRGVVINHKNAGTHEFKSLSWTRMNSVFLDEVADGFEKLRDRNRLRKVGLAASFPDALLIALHREGGDRDHWDRFQLVVLLDPLRDFQTRNLRQLNIHQDEVGPMLAGKVERLDPVAGLDGRIAVRFQ